ncbi:MAG: quinone-dependent dihydroorotate dehydrogenase, partial [Candidatus Dadabacteria bacterium]
MTSFWYEKIVRPFLFRLDPESAHNFVLKMLHILEVTRLYRLISVNSGIYEKGSIRVFGCKFRNRVGLAAGFDKDCLAPNVLASFGFSHIELGTVLLSPQRGNPRPRIFRFPDEHALINKMGFPSVGVDLFLKRLKRAAHSAKKSGIVLGVSIGKNRSTGLDEAAYEYRKVFEAIAPYADYVAINVSSPNTPGLRKLQHGDHLRGILSAINEAKGETIKKDVPLLLKLSPDLKEKEVEEILEIALSWHVSGIIAGNTTVDRSSLPGAVYPEGGLSGKPLKEKNLRLVEQARKIAGKRIAIIGVGGIFCRSDLDEYIDAGAD